MQAVMQAYECLWCPAEPFQYRPGVCVHCEKPLFALGVIP